MAISETLMYLTLDLGEDFGWARAIGRETPTWGVEHLPNCGEDYGLLYLNFRNYLVHAFKHVRRPACVGVPTPIIFGAQFSHSDRILMGLLATLETVCGEMGINMMEQYEATMRAEFLKPYPTPRAQKQVKPAIMNRCKALGWDVTDHNAADALCTMEYLRASIYKTEGWPSAAERSGLFKETP